MARFRQRSRIAYSSVTSFAALAVATVAVPAAAQDEAAAADAPAGDEIVVTAQFRAQNLQDTPLAITAVNAEMLEARSQTNISQVAAQAPSVTLKRSPSNAAKPSATDTWYGGLT